MKLKKLLIVALAAGHLGLAAAAAPDDPLVPVHASVNAPGNDPAAVTITTDPNGPRNMSVSETAAADGAKVKGTVKDPSYQSAIEQLLPLTPEQVRDKQAREDELAKAMAERKAPDSATMTIPVTMRTGSPPPEIQLSDDYVTALSLVDVTGEPWPILRAQVGNSQMFALDLPEKPGNVIVISPQLKYAASNLMLIPVGSHAPIMLSLRTTRSMSYYSANLMVDERGPMANTPTSETPPDPVDNSLMRRILDGSGALAEGVREVQITGGAQTSAYYVGNKFYMRTPYTLISPAWTASIRSGGIRVYELAPAAQIVVADENGRTLSLKPDDQTLLDSAIAANATARQ